MDPKDIKLTRLALIFIGIPAVIAAAIGLYFLTEPIFCKNYNSGLSRDFCGLSLFPNSIAFGVFGIVFIIVCLVKLSKKNQPRPRYSAPEKKRVALGILGKTLLWTILICAFLAAVLVAILNRSTLAIVISALLLIAMIVLAVFNSYKKVK